MMTLEDKLAKLDELRASRKEIDDEIAVLFGMGKEGEGIVRPVEKKEKKKKSYYVPKGKPWATTPKPCCGSKGARHFKTCVNFPGNLNKGNNGDEGEKREEKPREPLTMEQYADVKNAIHDGEFQSAKYSLVNKLHIREVNEAIRSNSYDNYLELRTQKL